MHAIYVTGLPDELRAPVVPVDEWGRLTADEAAACLPALLDNFPQAEGL